MKKSFTRIMAALALLVFMAPSMVAWGQVESGTTYSTPSISNLPNGWSGVDGGGTSYIKLVASDHYIQTSEFGQNGFTSITLKARKFGGPSDTQALITVSWYNNNTETVLGTIAPTNTSLSDYTISSPTNPTGNTTGYIKIQCKGASSSKGSGVSAVTITYTASSVQPTTHTLTFNADPSEGGTLIVGNNLSSPTTVTENAELNISATANTGYVFNNWTVSGTGSSVADATNASTTFTMGTVDATLTANFTQVTTYTVTYKANGPEADDIVVIYNAGANVTVAANTFNYPLHSFTKWNTAANGTGTDYLPAATIENIQANVELYAQWEESNETVDVLTNSNTIGETTTNYKDWTTDAFPSGAKYAGNSAGSNGTIQLRSNNNNSGIVTTTSGGLAKKVVVTWNSSTSSGRTLNVYGKSTAYTAASDLYGNNAGTLIGSIVCGTSTELTISDDYAFIGLRSDNGAMYIDEIRVTWEPNNDPTIATSITINDSNLNNDLSNNTNTNGGSLSATVLNDQNEAIEGATVTWESSNTGVATIDATGAVTLVAVGTTTITATYAGVANQYKPSEATYTLNVVDSYAAGGANNPYTVAQAIEATPSSGESGFVYIHGIVSDFYNTSITGDGSNYRYYISDDGTSTDQLLVYKGKGLNQVTFANADDLLVGDIVTVYGKLTTYNNVKEVASGNYLTSWERPETPAQEYTLTIANPANVTITAVYGTDGILSNGDVENILSGTEISVNLNVASGYVLDALTVTGENNQTVDVTENEGMYSFNMPAFNVTVNATVSVSTTGTYTLATSIESGKQYIIVGQADGNYYAMGNDKGNNRYAYGITLNETTATANIANTGVHEFTITSLETEGYYSIMDATTNGGYLYAASSGNNYLKTESTLDENHNGDWKITITDGSFSVVADQSENRNVMQFNNSSKIFACYTSASQHPVFLYVKDETPAPEYTLTIKGYTDDNAKDGYYLIASPVNVDPSTVGMTDTDGDYDLYYFDQAGDAEGKEWINYKQGSFNLVPGKGYLYAKKATTEGETFTFTLTGTAYDGASITLAKTEGGDFPGWNLVGNPYNENAYIDGRDFYVMNAAGGEIEVANDRNYIKPMEGVFVIAETDGETLDISTTAPEPNNGGSKLTLNVTGTRGIVIDRAIVRFGEGRQLPKFQLNAENTKIYFAQADNDYAVVRSDNEGEMPVSFKAAENGTYTLSFEAENTEMRYMHLIDNMTGADIDLLATPSYSFEANTNDYANRFRIVFKANNSVEEMSEEHFAFFNGSEWVVSNEGEATLQVIDMMGRVLSSQTINGNANVKVNEAKGVYVIRMIQNGQVKNQKIVKE